MQYLTVKNWEEFQHYKDRNPPWIKLHRGVLDDYDMSCLQDASKLHLILIWLLSSQLNNRIPNDPEWVKNKIGAKSDVNLNELIDNGFLVMKQDASNSLSVRKQDAIPETETETETERYREEKRREDAPVKDFIPIKEWEAFKEMREETKKPLTSYAERLAIKRLEEFHKKGHNIAEVLNHSTLNSYPDIYEPKEKPTASKTTDELIAAYKPRTVDEISRHNELLQKYQGG